MAVGSKSSGWGGRVLIDNGWLPVRRYSHNKDFVLFASEPTYNGLNHHYTTAAQNEYSQAQIIYKLGLEGEIWRKASRAGQTFDKLLQASLENRSTGLTNLILIPSHGNGTHFMGDVTIDSLNINSSIGNSVNFTASLLASDRETDTTGMTFDNTDFADSPWSSDSVSNIQKHTTGPIPAWQSSITLPNIADEPDAKSVSWSLNISNKATPLYSHMNGKLIPSFIYPGFLEITGSIMYYNPEADFENSIPVESAITISFGDFSLSYTRARFSIDELPNEGLNTIVHRNIHFRVLLTPAG